jgi:hemerythrin superfamily protein
MHPDFRWRRIVFRIQEYRMAKSASKSAPPPGAPSSADAARAVARPGDWLWCALEHHDQIRTAFEAARKAPPGGARAAAMKGLAVVLNGHSLAEEVVLYPALMAIDAAEDADTAYAEQTEAKIQMAELERLSPASPDWVSQLEQIQTAVLAHMEKEESSWFLELKENYPEQARLTARYREEFERYTRTGIVATNGT